MTENRSTSISGSHDLPGDELPAGRQRPGQSDPDRPSARSPRSLQAASRARPDARPGAGDGVVRRARALLPTCWTGR